jgi:hypothetical protein
MRRIALFMQACAVVSIGVSGIGVAMMGKAVDESSCVSLLTAKNKLYM